MQGSDLAIQQLAVSHENRACTGIHLKVQQSERQRLMSDMGLQTTNQNNESFGSGHTHAVWKQSIGDFALIHCIRVLRLRKKEKRERSYHKLSLRSLRVKLVRDLQ